MVTRAPLVQPGELVRIRNQRWRVARSVGYGETAILDVAGCDAANRGIRAQFVLPIERVERVPISHEPRLVRPARWRRIARLQLAEAVPRIDSLRAAARADVVVIPFQLEPALAITRGVGCRLLIADDVGLGKTIQAGLLIAEVLDRVPDGRALVVCPAGLRDQWRHELEHRFALHVTTLDSTTAARAPQAAAGTNPWAAFAVVITSIDYVKRPEVIRSLESLVWDVAVFDEAHALSGSSERAAAASALAKRSRVVVMLTATPHSGDDAAFARLCATGRLTSESPVLLFRRTRIDAGFALPRRTRWFRVRTTADELEMHAALARYARLVCSHGGGRPAAARLAMTVLIKRACSSASSLARSVERRMALLSATGSDTEAQLALPFDASGTSDDEPVAELAAPGLNDVLEECRHLKGILMLARNASARESKLLALGRLLRRSSEPVIVFTEYRDTLARIASVMPDVKPVQLHGGLTIAERRDSLSEFMHGSATLLLATDAASEGLNLHHRCRVIVNVELPWTPLRLEQRVGRVDRIGQRARVHALHLIASGTAEEHTVARLLERMGRARSAMPASSVSDEDAIARAVVGFPAAKPVAHRSETPFDSRDVFIVPELNGVAIEEATFIATARSLQQHASKRPETRPVVTALRHRGRSRNHRTCWAFRVSYTDSANDVLWSTILGVEAMAPFQRATDAARRAMKMTPAAIDRAVRARHHEALYDVRVTLEQWATLGRRRERNIMRELVRSRARLAAVQRGLFDHRADRAASAQSAVLEQALSRCADRLRDLDRLTSLAMGSRSLVFAVTLE